MSRPRAVGLLLALSLALPAGAPAAPAGNEEALVRETLPNGARLIVQARPGCGTFALELLSEGGLQEDDDAHYGLSSVIANLLLKGTDTRTAARQALDVEGTGSTVEPVTGTAVAGLQAAGPAVAFQAVLDVVADAVRAPNLLPEALAREVELERQALRGSLDDPSTSLERALRPIVYGRHPLGRVADPDRYLEGVDAAAVRAAHAGRFVGARLVLVIVGDLDPQEALRAGREAIGPLPGGLPFTPPSSPAPLLTEKRGEAHRRTTQPMLFVGVPTTGLGEAEWPAMDLLVEILAGFQERLSTEIRETRGWAYWVQAEDRRYRGAGLFGIRTAVPARHLRETETIVRRELARIAAEPPGDDEMERARRIVLTEQARAWQRSSARASAFAYRETRGLPPLTFDQQEAVLRGVTAQDVSSLAGRLLAASRPAVVTLR